MKKRNLILVLSIFIISQLNLNAQNFRIEAPPGYNFVYQSNGLPKGVDGSPYLSDWQPAELHFKNGKMISELMMRYNVYTGQMLYQKDNQTFAIGSPDSIAKIEFNDKVFKYKTFVIDDKLVQKYYEIIVDGDVSLYNEYEIVISRSNYNTALDVGDKNDKFVLKERMFIKQGDKLAEVDKKKKIVEVLSDKENELTKYMKKQKLSYKNKEDMAKLVEYYIQISSNS